MGTLSALPFVGGTNDAGGFPRKQYSTNFDAVNSKHIEQLIELSDFF